MAEIRIHTVPQRSPEWYALRAGKLTGSSAKDMLASIKSGEAAARRDLRYKLMAERLTGQSQEDGYVNAAMQHGIDCEPLAVAAYEAATGNLVEPVGFVERTDILAGTSPDGFVGERGLISVKCPKTATHVRYLREGIEPSEHVAQNSHELWITERDWIDFVSFDPRLPEPLQLWIHRVTRTTTQLYEYNRQAMIFLAAVDDETLAVRTMTDLCGQLAGSL